ncbi:MAG: hypothetical protein ABF651_00225 [Sporolactobacillus sp.]
MVEILAIFEHSLYIEMALSALTQMNVDRQNIAVFPLKKPLQSTKNQPYNGTSQSDLGFIFATISGVIGASIGFILYLGPIVWGIGAALFGFVVGLLINKFISRKKKAVTPHVLLIVKCPHAQSQNLEKVLWDNQSIGMTIIQYEK